MSLLARAADRLNPIVVKEVRQGLRTRVFWIFFSLMLLACLVLSLIAFAVSRSGHQLSAGKEFFFAYFVCLGVVHFFVIPYSAYRSLAREREEETWVLLTLTGLGPRRILRGKLGSYLVQAALYGSAAGPFLLFSYYLNGIDLPIILIVLALGAAYQLFLTAVSVSAATLADQRLTRAVAHFVVLGLLLGGTTQGLTVAFMLTEESGRLVGDDDFWLGAGAALWVMLSYGALLFEGAAARLSLPTENYSRGPRLVFLIQLVLSAAMWAYGWTQSRLDDDVPLIAQLLFCIHLTGVGLFIATDADGLAKRHRERTRFFSLLNPGALRGFRLVMVALALSTALWTTLYLSSRSINWTPQHRELALLVAAGAYVALYLSLALLLSRLLPHRAFRSPMVARLLFVLLLAVGAGLPPLVLAVAGAEPIEPLANFLNPVVGLANFEQGKLPLEAVWPLCAVAAVVALATDRVLAARDRPAPPEPSPKAA